MIRRHQVTLTAALLTMLGCGGGSQGTEPHEMSVEQHETTAGQEEQAGHQHGEQYNPAAETATERCSPRTGCWTSKSNPTEQHRADAEKHRDLAEKPRAAAQVLRDTEGKECVGLDAEDRDMSPFMHREDISTVSKVEREVQRGNVKAGQIAGGRAVFRAVPGMTVEWLQRLVNCHAARASALGHNVPEMGYCPLMLNGAKATVSSTGAGFAIDVTADDTKTAEEIWRRMQALTAPQEP